MVLEAGSTLVLTPDMQTLPPSPPSSPSSPLRYKIAPGTLVACKRNSIIINTSLVFFTCPQSPFLYASANEDKLFLRSYIGLVRPILKNTLEFAYSMLDIFLKNSALHSRVLKVCFAIPGTLEVSPIYFGTKTLITMC